MTDERQVGLREALEAAIKAELAALPMPGDDPEQEAFHDGAAAAYHWCLAALAVAQVPAGESEPCPFCSTGRSKGAGCIECRGRGTVGSAFRANRGLAPLAQEERVDVLAAAINDAQVQPSELRLGRDLRPVAARILKALPDAPALPAPEDLAEALHHAMCDVSHHDRQPGGARCHRWPTYPLIARSALDELRRMAARG